MPSCSGMVVVKSHGTFFSRQPLWQQQCLTQQRSNGNGEEVLLKLKCPQAEFHKSCIGIARRPCLWRGRLLPLGCRATQRQEADTHGGEEKEESEIDRSTWRDKDAPREDSADKLATSSLKDQPMEGVPPNAPSEATGSVFGAMALITGTSVGAGILALPATTAPSGFLPSATLMIVSWAFLVLEALLLAEVNVELMKRRRLGETLHSEVLSLRTMADQTMGSNGGIFTAVTYLFLTYTLLVAYIAKSGEVLSLMLSIPMPFAAALFTFGFGGLLCIGGSKVADSVNQVLTVSLIGLFLLIVVGGASMADWKGLQHTDWSVAPQALPIIFLALVYHDLTPVNRLFEEIENARMRFLTELDKHPIVPVVCAQLGGDIDRIRKSIILGSLVPLAMFLSWDAVALCLAPLSGAQDPIDYLMRVGGPGPAFVVEAFALLAVATSFIGSVLGLSEFLLEQLGNAQSPTVGEGSPKNTLVVSEALQPVSEWWKTNGNRAFSYLLVLAPPLMASSVVSDAFFSASDLAGAYGMTSLYGIIPPAMAWNLHRASAKKRNICGGISVPGGKLTLASIGLCAAAVICGQVVLDVPHLFLQVDPHTLLVRGSPDDLATLSIAVNYKH